MWKWLQILILPEMLSPPLFILLLPPLHYLHAELMNSVAGLAGSETDILHLLTNSKSEDKNVRCKIKKKTEGQGKLLHIGNGTSYSTKTQVWSLWTNPIPRPQRLTKCWQNPQRRSVNEDRLWVWSVCSYAVKPENAASWEDRDSSDLESDLELEAWPLTSCAASGMSLVSLNMVPQLWYGWIGQDDVYHFFWLTISQKALSDQLPWAQLNAG